MSKANDDWNLCLPVNIYVYKNGGTGAAPTLVHISADMKKTMKSALEAIQNRLKIEAGYAEGLYYTSGYRVCRTTELQMYEEYVVVTSLDSKFRCVEYGRPKSPLLVPGHGSKHIRSICVNDNSYNMFNINRRKKEDKKSKYGFIYRFDRDGYGPNELPYVANNSVQCGTLCQNVKRCEDCEPPCRLPPQLPFYHLHHCPSPEQPPCTAVSQLPYREYMDEGGDEEGFYSEYKKECASVPGPNSQDMGVSTTDLQCVVDQYPGPGADSEHLLAFINRYRDIGGQLYKMFNDRLTADNGTNRHGGEMDDKDWYKEHLYEMFADRIAEMQSSKGESGTNNCTLDPSQSSRTTRTQGSGSRSSRKSLEFDNMSDSQTGAKPGGSNSSPTVNNQYQYQPVDPSEPRISLSALMQDGSAPPATGTTNPKKFSTNNPQIFHTMIRQDRNMSEFDLYRKRKEKADLIKRFSKYSFQKFASKHESKLDCNTGTIPSARSSGNNNTRHHPLEQIIRNDHTNPYTLEQVDASLTYTSDDDDDQRRGGATHRYQINNNDIRRQRRLADLDHPLPDPREEPYESVDEFERLYHRNSISQSPLSRQNSQQGRGRGVRMNYQQLSPDYERMSGRPTSPPAFRQRGYTRLQQLQNFSSTTDESDDEVQILHHRQTRSRPERQQQRQRLRTTTLPLQYRNARLLIPTYDTNGNFLHYVFQ